EALIDPIYARIAEIELLFNFHDPTSELSQYNQNALIPLSEEFKNLMAQAIELRAKSGGAFTPYVEEQKGRRLQDVRHSAVDFGGVAKGFVVDEAVNLAMRLDPRAQGFVEAGGDIRYFGQTDVVMNLRLGVPSQIFTRELSLSGERMAAATSSPGMAAEF